MGNVCFLLYKAVLILTTISCYMTSNFFVSRTISSYLLFSSFFFMRALHLSALCQIELAQSGGTSWCSTHHLVLSWQVLVQPGPRTRRVVQVSVPLMCFYVSLIHVVFHIRLNKKKILPQHFF